MKPGFTILNINSSEFYGTVPWDTPRKKELKSEPSAGKAMAPVFWEWKFIVLGNFLFSGTTVNCDDYIMKFIQQEHCCKCCSSITVPCHAHLRPSQYLDGQCSSTLLPVLTLHQQIFTCFIFQQTVCQVTIMWMMNYYWMLCTRHCKGRRATFEEMENILKKTLL
jgi:hypothetical protein